MRAAITVLIGKPKIKIGGKKYALPDDIEKSKVAQEKNEMTGGRLLVIILLAMGWGGCALQRERGTVRGFFCLL